MDLDAPFLPDEWTPAYGSRIFEFDGFISHRRADGSVVLQAALAALDVRTWHDGDADIRSRLVQDNVATALRHSRILVAFITPNFAESPWTRAEVTLAARSAAQAGCEGIVVFRGSGDAPPIPELSGVPCFRPGDEARLAEFLKTRNKLPRTALLAPWRRRPPRPRHAAALKQAIGRIHAADPAHVQCLRHGRFCLLDLMARALDEFEPLGDVVTRYLCEISAREWSAVRSDVRELVRSWAIHFLRCEYTDQRMNAFSVLAALARDASDPRSLAVLRHAYKREDHESIVNRAAPVVGPGIRPAAYEMSLLRHHLQMGHDKVPYARLVAPEVRLRVQREAPFDMTLLPPMHRLALARSSLLVMLEQAEAGQTTGFALDLEASLATFEETFFRPLAQRDPAAVAASGEVLELFERAVRVSLAHDGTPLALVTDVALGLFLPQAMLLSREYPERGERLVTEAAKLFLPASAGWPTLAEDLRDISEDRGGSRAALLSRYLGSAESAP
jgi:hypothetical protein